MLQIPGTRPSSTTGMPMRHAARAAYYHVQSDERVRRALAGRTRHRESPGMRRARVLLPEDQGQQAWNVARARNCDRLRGSQCLGHQRRAMRALCPRTPPASNSRGTRASLQHMRAARDDLDRLLNLDDEDAAFEEEDDGGGVGDIDPGEEEAVEDDLGLSSSAHDEASPDHVSREGPRERDPLGAHPRKGAPKVSSC